MEEGWVVEEVVGRVAVRVAVRVVALAAALAVREIVAWVALAQEVWEVGMVVGEVVALEVVGWGVRGWGAQVAAEAWGGMLALLESGLVGECTHLALQAFCLGTRGPTSSCCSPQGRRTCCHL